LSLPSTANDAVSTTPNATWKTVVAAVSNGLFDGVIVQVVHLMLMMLADAEKLLTSADIPSWRHSLIQASIALLTDKPFACISILSTCRSHAVVSHMLGDAHMLAGNWKAAFTAYNDALRSWPDSMSEQNMQLAKTMIGRRKRTKIDTSTMSVRSAQEMAALLNRLT